MHLFGRRRTARTQPPAHTPATPPEEPGIPPWAMSAVEDFLAPFLRGEGLEADPAPYGTGRDFLKEVEQTERIRLNWGNGRQSAGDDLWGRIHQDQRLLLGVLRYACEHILLGCSFQEYDAEARRLDEALRRAGADWELVKVPDRTSFQLRRRVSAATSEAVRRATTTVGSASEHLNQAWQHAYGRDPDPSRAYAEAVMAVEAASIPVVTPNDPQATLGRVVGTLRSNPGRWRLSLSRPARLTGGTMDSVEVLIANLDLLWHNQIDRHAQADPQPPVPVTQEQAETAVHLALLLVQVFRSGAIRPV